MANNKIYLLIEALVVILLLSVFFAVYYYLYIYESPYDKMRQEKNFIEQVSSLEKDAAFVHNDQCKIIRAYYGPNREVVYLQKWTRENVLNLKPGFPISHFLAYSGIQEGELPSFAIDILLPLDQNQPPPDKMMVHFNQFEKIDNPDEKSLKENDPKVIRESDHILPADKIGFYTEDTFYEKVIIQNGFKHMNLKKPYIDFTSAKVAYPSLMVGAYLKRVYDTINRNTDKQIDFTQIKQDLDKAKYYALKANTDSVKNIYRYNIDRDIKMLNEQQQKSLNSSPYLSEQDFNTIKSLLEEYSQKL
jgi:hypothetical protein